MKRWRRKKFRMIRIGYHSFVATLHNYQPLIMLPAEFSMFQAKADTGFQISYRAIADIDSNPLYFGCMSMKWMELQLPPPPKKISSQWVKCRYWAIEMRAALEMWYFGRITNRTCENKILVKFRPRSEFTWPRYGGSDSWCETNTFLLTLCAKR